MPASANVIEFHSNKIHRVVRSSLAAEGCAMASSADRQLFNRVIFDAMTQGTSGKRLARSPVSESLLGDRCRRVA